MISIIVPRSIRLACAPTTINFSPTFGGLNLRSCWSKINFINPLDMSSVSLSLNC